LIIWWLNWQISFRWYSPMGFIKKISSTWFYDLATFTWNLPRSINSHWCEIFKNYSLLSSPITGTYTSFIRYIKLNVNIYPYFCESALYRCVFELVTLLRMNDLSRSYLIISPQLTDLEPLYHWFWFICSHLALSHTVWFCLRYQALIWCCNVSFPVYLLYYSNFFQVCISVLVISKLPNGCAKLFGTRSQFIVFLFVIFIVT